MVLALSPSNAADKSKASVNECKTWERAIQARTNYFQLNKNKETGWQTNQIKAVKGFNYKWFDHEIKTKNNLFLLIQKNFTGKTETGWKFTTPLMKMKSCKLTTPPPGDDLVIPGK